VNVENESTIIKLENFEIKIPNNNSIQRKVLLLTLLNSGILKNSEIAELLDISKVQVSNLSKGLIENDVLSLIEKRKGQQKNYVINKDVKSELIQQYVANLVTGKSISSNNITKQVNEVCKTDIADRTIRQYISKIGLNKVKRTFPELLKEFKKNLKG